MRPLEASTGVREFWGEFSNSVPPRLKHVAQAVLGILGLQRSWSSSASQPGIPGPSQHGDAKFLASSVLPHIPKDYPDTRRDSRRKTVPSRQTA